MNETVLIVIISLYAFFTLLLFIFIVLLFRVNYSYDTIEEN